MGPEKSPWSFSHRQTSPPFLSQDLAGQSSPRSLSALQQRAFQFAEPALFLLPALESRGQTQGTDAVLEAEPLTREHHRQLCVLPPVLGSEGTASISPFLPVAPRFSKVAANSELANADSHCSWGNPRLGSQEPLVTTSLVNNLMSGYQMSV
jgi:hypothetical protein